MPKNKYEVIWTQHHIILDGWSISILQKDFFEDYLSLKVTKEIVQQNKINQNLYFNRLKNTNNSSSKSFWNEYLKGFDAISSFEKYLHHDKNDTFDRNIIKIEISNVLYKKLLDLSAISKLTTTAIIQYAWSVLLSKYTRCNDVIFGSVVSGRTIDVENMHQMVGMFINTIPIRVNFDSSKTNLNNISDIQDLMISQIQHHELSFSEILHESALGKSTLDHVLVFENFPVFDSEIKSFISKSGFDLSLHKSSIQTFNQSNYNLSIAFVPNHCSIEVQFIFNANVFNSIFIENLSNHFLNALVGVIDNINGNISNLSLLKSVEVQKQINLGLGPKIEYDINLTILDYFHEHVNNNPNSTALILKDKEYSYEELNSLSNQLANYIINNYDINPNDFITLKLERNEWMLVSILGVLKAGAAYVPIDPNYPSSRIDFIIKDSKSKLLIDEHEIEIFKIQRSLFSRNNLKNRPQPSDLAYCIYTSGSTGNPKGVMIEHGMLLASNIARSHYYDDTQNIGLLLYSYAFDSSINLTFRMLFGGKTLFLYPYTEIDLSELQSIINTFNIDTITIPPGLYDMLMEYGDVSTLKNIIVAGEECKIETAQKHIDKKINASLFNEYGPTECTVWSSVHKITGNEIVKIPIGRPIANSYTMIIDQWGQMAPEGVPGEIFIGGKNVGRGYLNNPILTETKFVNNPYSNNEIIYRTGDLGCWNESGELVYLGRIDNQIKIRGFRVELGEVESAICKIPKVTNAVVVAKEMHGTNELIAYYIGGIDSLEVKSQLKTILPNFLVPNFIIQINDIPLTINLKVDFSALPIPESIGMKIGVNQEPSTVNEKILAQIWSEVLRIKLTDIGLNSDFFDYGGDSIKSILILAKLRNAGVELKISEVMGNSNFLSMASFMRPLSRKIDQGFVTQKHILSPIQLSFLGNDFIYGEIENKQQFNQSFLLEFNGNATKDELKTVFQKITEHHDVLRSLFIEDQGKWFQTYGLASKNYLEVNEYDLSKLSGKEFDDELISISKKLKSRINFINGPLFRIGLFHGEFQDLLLLTIHHLVIDLVSWRILLEDIEKLLFELRKGLKLVLPEKTDSYKYWAEKTMNLSNSSVFQNDLDYWNQIDQFVPDQIPIASLNAKNTFSTHHNITISFDIHQTSFLKSGLNKNNKIDLESLLLLAFGKGLFKSFKVVQTKVNLEGHGRDELIGDCNVSRTLGWFTSAYPVILNVPDDNLSLFELIEYDQYLKTIPANGISYGILTSARKIGVDDKKVLPNVDFNYLGEFYSTTSLSENSLIAISKKFHGDEDNSNLERKVDLIINAQVLDNELILNITFSKERFDVKSLIEFTDNYKNVLIDYSKLLSLSEHTYTVPTDFTYNKISIANILDLKKRYGEIDDIYELTPMQLGLMYLSSSGISSDAYFEQFEYKLQGDLNIDLYRFAFSETISSVDVLRSVFRDDIGDIPLQIIRNTSEIEFTYSELDYLDLESELDCLKKNDKVRGFKLDNGPLIRLQVFKIGFENYYVLWSTHHIILDGWSMNKLIIEFNNRFISLLKNEDFSKFCSLPKFSNYLKHLRNIDVFEGLRYWDNYLLGYDTFVQLPGFKNQNSDYLYAEYCFNFPESTSHKLINFAAKSKVSLSALMQTIWGLILSKYNNCNDVVFGTIVSGRNIKLPEVENIIGLLINMVPVRLKYDSFETFDQIIQKFNNLFISGEEFHFQQLSEIQRRINQGINLINHFTVFENYPENKIDSASTDNLYGWGNLVKGSEKVLEQNTYDFSIVFEPSTNFGIKICYNSNSYNSYILENIEKHWRKSVDWILFNSNCQISDLTILTTDEETYLLETLNDTKVAYPEDKTIVDLFEEQVAKTPDNIAIVFEDTKLSYRELNELSNQLGDYLRITYAIKPDDLIGIKLDRSEWMIISILGILKSGGAYVPIDPEYPQERIDYIIEDSQCKIVIDTEELEKFKQEQEKYSKENKQINLLPSNLMYCIYTSGSTGNPKGCLLEHLGVVNYLASTKIYQSDESKHEVAIFSTLSFDFTVTSVFGGLLTGKQLNIYTQSIDLTLSLNNIVSNPNSEVLKLTPAHIHLIEESSLVQSPPKSFVLGGEALSVEQIRKLKKNKGARIYNEYGPTEATVGCIVKEVSLDETPLIGKPIQNTSVYILDKHHQLLPYGSIGEICIGGVGLARGYLNREELTKEKFIENTYKPGERIYRTGDLGRWNEDQNLEYLGRIDDQVKIRGYRIELGEIESVLSQHEQVTAVVVVAKAISGEEKELIAYTTGEAEASELKSYLKEKLPSYMVPSYYVKLDTIPLTSNGKVNRKALPMPEGTGISTNNYIAPSTAIEKSLVKIWSDVLRAKEETIGIQTDFFDLGGDSIKAIKLMGLIHQKFNIKTQLIDLFQNPTIKSFSEFLSIFANDNTSSTNYEIEI